MVEMSSGSQASRGLGASLARLRNPGRGGRCLDFRAVHPVPVAAAQEA